jgi:hypothetical protein
MLDALIGRCDPGDGLCEFELVRIDLFEQN